MTKKELFEKLKDVPDDTPIRYRDMNFGGINSYDTFENWHISYEEESKSILVSSAQFEPVD